MNATQLSQFKEILLRCRNSTFYFIENFCKIKHPKAGVIPFALFDYQKQSIQLFKKYRFNIYKKCRQMGISTITGAFALWYAMFYANKTVLVVSKRDLDAMEFLNRNVKFLYDNLPDEFHEIYGDPPKIYNEHAIGFPNGSTIQSLTSQEDTLRSHSSSLNIIDEAAFMPHMEAMWSGGQQTMAHGGSCIVISSTNGMGNWYHSTWEDAVSHANEFNPIEFNWWDMGWTIEYVDELTGKKMKLSPRDGIRECITKEDKDKWGKYYSPWLEEQYRQLQLKGEAHLFRQEILAEFVGTGGTVLPASVLSTIKESTNDSFRVVESVNYEHPVSGQKSVLNFERQLWVWKPPVKAIPPILENGRIIKPAVPAHAYGLGVDISSGEDTDYSAIEVIDYTTMEQAAELSIRTYPATLVQMVDYIARWYNMAYVIPERTGMGIPVCQSIYNDVAYSNVYRMKTVNGKRTSKVGYSTSPTYKPALVKCLLDHLSSNDPTNLYSTRLFAQLSIFVHLGGKKVGNVKGIGNHDDLVIALALALIGILESFQSDQRDLLPTKTPDNSPELQQPKVNLDEMMTAGGLDCLMPIMPGADIINIANPADDLNRFARQLGGTVIKQNKDLFQR